MGCARSIPVHANDEQRPSPNRRNSKHKHNNNACAAVQECHKRPTLNTTYSEFNFNNSSQKSLYSYAAPPSVIGGNDGSSIHGEVGSGVGTSMLGGQPYPPQQATYGHLQMNVGSRQRLLHTANHNYGDTESLYEFSLDGYNTNYDGNDGTDTIITNDFESSYYGDRRVCSDSLRMHQQHPIIYKNVAAEANMTKRLPNANAFVQNKGFGINNNNALGIHQLNEISFEDYDDSEELDSDGQVSLLGPMSSTIGTTVSPMIGGDTEDDMNSKSRNDGTDSVVQIDISSDLMKMPTLKPSGATVATTTVATTAAAAATTSAGQPHTSSCKDGIGEEKDPLSPTKRTDDGAESRDPPPFPRHADEDGRPLGTSIYQPDPATSLHLERRREYLKPTFSTLWGSGDRLKPQPGTSLSTSLGGMELERTAPEGKKQLQRETSAGIPISTRHIVESLAQRYIERDVEAPPGELGIACRCKHNKTQHRPSGENTLQPKQRGIVVDAMDETSPLAGSVLPGDVILKIDGRDTAELSMVQFSRLLIESWDRPRTLHVQTDTAKSYAYQEFRHY
mmetsp:Transcript_2217/g.5724  ORF Transcript_2217/g.5724 Transcript_2217/m.5724 type:complete len:563 (+) Transcript_2217:2047-3735(+)